MKKRRANDLDLKRWKQYDDVWTDSLWIIDSRDKSGAHHNGYHGNFVPQIPRQLITRFTRKGDVVLDAFLGSGTALIEAKRLGRRGIGIELLPAVARMAKKSIAKESGTAPSRLIVADSSSAKALREARRALREMKRRAAKLLILHPPYHDIIRFSSRKEDLSNTTSAEAFARKFGDVAQNLSPLIERGGHLAIVIGDIYRKSEWVPLAFRLLQETQRRDPSLRLKSIIVKNMAGNRAKLNQERLWRYRALKGGYYIFKHEYILLFCKS